MNAISNKVIERLTLYHCILKYSWSEKSFISSHEIASFLNLDDSQVRKDIALCGVLGKQKSGYPVNELKKSIEKKLSFQETNNVFIIGTGNLGEALTKYSDFKDYGIEIKGLFDTNPSKIGQIINGHPVYSMDDLKEKIIQKNIQTVILTVPPQQAQKVCNQIVSMGICFIWNFSPCILKVPSYVTVHYENIIIGFLQMKNNNEEKVILVNNENQQIGTCGKMQAHIQGRLHRAFSGFVFNEKKELLIQKRALSKYHNPGIWSNTVCSHPRMNEKNADAVNRRLYEEFGFNSDFTEIGQMTYQKDFDNGLIEHEIDHIFIAQYKNQKINPNKDEICDYKWISKKNLLSEIQKNPENFSYWMRQILKQNMLDNYF